MANKTPMALPPGMVPSSSREDMTSLDDLDPPSVVSKELPLLRDDPGRGEGRLPQAPKPEAEVASAPAGKALNAWPSPPHPKEGEGEEEELEREIGFVQPPVNRNITSPFISTSTPNPQEQGSPKPKMPTQDTPRRVMSPLKKFNRVVPSSQPPNPLLQKTLELNAEGDGSLRSSSASFLEQKTATPTEKKDRPDSAPLDRDDTLRNRRQVPIDARVIVKNREDSSKQVVESIPAYSTVVKSKGKPRVREESKTKTKTSNALPVVPTLEAYEPEPPLDTSIVISNRGTTSSLMEPLQTSQVMENDYTMTPDPLYSTVEEVDSSTQSLAAPSRAEKAAYNAALLKQLKKHDDKGTVQLVSIKGISTALNQEPVNFPQGSSADMHALHYAAASGDKKALAEQISALPLSQDTVEMVLGTEKLFRREGIDMVDSEGRTPLMHAVHNNKLHAVKMLVENGANVNMNANDGSTVLHQAAFNGSLEIVALLLSLGADGLLRDFEGRTPLHWCANNNDAQCIKILLDKVPGLDVDIRDGASMTSLMWAAFNGRTEQVRALLEKGADPALRDMDGMTAAHWSIQRHDTHVLQMLINSESVNYLDNKGRTLMHQAAEQGSAKAISLIKAVKPTSVDDQDLNGRTPLHWATVCENPEVIRALLHHGCNPNVKDSSGRTALDYATEKGLHYCGLILTKAESTDAPDDYHSILMYGSSSATAGYRALNYQEGILIEPDEIKSTLNSEQMLQIQTVCTGSWIYKFTNNGKGPLHPRYFRVNPSNTKICWAKGRNANDKETKSDILVGTRSSASPAIYGRKDFDPIDKHKYAFTIFTSNRVLDVVAVSSEDYKLWINGLQLILQLGSVNVIRLMSAIQNTSAGEPKPIP